MRGRILVVDDEQDTASAIAELLVRRGFTARAVAGASACLEEVPRAPTDVVVTDVMMPGVSGIELCEQLRTTYPEILSIVLTGRGGIDVATSALRAGAYDFLCKPIAIAALELALTRAMVHIELQRELSNLRGRTDEQDLDSIAGDSEPVRQMINWIEQVASSDATVLITGESGTGKELVARALHRRSPRQHEPFIAVNCAAMPGALLESELFGHVRGAFTDANRNHPGLFVMAGEGTILLDEIGEMPMEMQVKLLRVLQSRKVRAVGSDTEVPVRARVVVATNRDLEQAVAQKRFREDLFYRINVIPISVPPIRVREADILLLAHHFVRRIAGRSGKPVVGITEPAARLLIGYEWPGNVRELENCMERAVALCRLDMVTVDDLPPNLYKSSARYSSLCGLPNELVTLAEMERHYVRHVVAATHGNKSEAARVLGIDRRSVYRLLARS
jgi:two-component system, NtrC family, response regulator AtoC